MAARQAKKGKKLDTAVAAATGLEVSGGRQGGAAQPG
jgi:hypothetical protein